MSNTTTCPECNKEISIGEFPFCPHGFGSNSVIGDECDVLVKHGICNEDGTPRRYTSKSEMAQEAKKRGLVNHVEHIPKPGSDKSPHTSRWV